MQKANAAVDSLRSLLTDSIQTLPAWSTVEMFPTEKTPTYARLLRAIREGGTDKIISNISKTYAEQDSLASTFPHVMPKSSDTYQFLHYP